ncbi:hypothetical protein HAX54_043237 [Datura stramonium]|uniref:Disease resistance N-terminal domain-containing protein n=1 Tax=Datura stramonium TaxID=4076 RepID=A0ABS8SNE3_DATST|nr:hypothetical protein [Datura stramonium]
MFQKHKHHVRLLRKLKMTLVGLQAVLSDAENKQASNPHVSQWIDELRDAVDGAENLMEEVNYEALRLKVEGQHQNLAETSNQQNEIEDLIDRLLSEDASGKNLTVLPIVGMGVWGPKVSTRDVEEFQMHDSRFALMVPKLLNRLEENEGSQMLKQSGHGGMRMEDLGESCNLYGSLSILDLQNVVDGREALKAIMREKERVEMLSLVWGETASTIVFSNCKDWVSSPALGQSLLGNSFPLDGCNGITEVTEEFDEVHPPKAF